MGCHSGLDDGRQRHLTHGEPHDHRPTCHFGRPSREYRLLLSNVNVKQRYHAQGVRPKITLRLLTYANVPKPVGSFPCATNGPSDGAELQPG